MSEETETELEEPAPPKKKKKKKRRATPSNVDADAANVRVYPGIEDDQVPAFARSFPEDPTLDELVVAFEAGRYAEVRERAQKLVHETEREAVRRAAREMLKRLEPDPLAIYLLAGAAVLLVFLAGYYWLHPHAQ